MDLGTGDGRAVLAAASADPHALVVGIDAEATAMAEASRRASRSGRPAGVPNAIFVASGADRLPAELNGFAARVTVRFPWGSLLRGALGLEPGMTAAIARLVAPGGELAIVLSLLARDAVDGRHAGPFGAGDIARIRTAFARHGLRLEVARRMTPTELAATSSSWARRLRAGADRPAWSLRLRRDAESPGGGPSGERVIG